MGLKMHPQWQRCPLKKKKEQPNKSVDGGRYIHPFNFFAYTTGALDAFLDRFIPHDLQFRYDIRCVSNPITGYLFAGGSTMLTDILEKISWLGHDGFMIKADGKVVIIDPYQVTTAQPADIVLITHSHHDHCSPDDIEKFQTNATVIVTEPESARMISGDVRVMKPKEVVEVTGVTVEAVPAYNTNKKFHPRKKNWLGFILTIAGCRIYHAGDTDLIDEMAELDVDIALLPVSGTYVMTAEEAVEAAKRIKPKVAIPMHYDSLVGSEADARAFADGLKGVCAVKILTRL